MSDNKNNPKPKKSVDKKEVKPMTIVDRSEVDKHIIDLVLRTLYNNSDIDVLHLEDDIYKPAKVEIPHKEAERLWEVMTSSGLIKPVVGYGNAGKIELSRSGYQLMAQFGGYIEYINSLKRPDQLQTVPEQVEQDDDCKEVTPVEGKKAEEKDSSEKKAK